MTCKQCIHHVACNRYESTFQNRNDEPCIAFSDRSLWVKLPSEDYTFTIRGDLVRGIIVANCRAAEEAERALKERESNER